MTFAAKRALTSMEHFTNRRYSFASRHPLLPISFLGWFPPTKRITLAPTNMGKPFANELTQLPLSLRWAGELDIAPVTKFLAQACGNLLIAIGAGGSFTAVEFARLLHENRGGTSLALTPLGFLQSPSAIRDAYVLIFTASGKNRDILAAYEAALQREPAGILIICGKANSKIERLAQRSERTVVFARPLPAGSDGYLATNSLAAMTALLVRAFGFPPVAVSEVWAGDDAQPRAWAKTDRPGGSCYYLALFGGWGRPAATDLESKFSEAGLGGVMLADYRNFAHGRHNWIDKRGDQSAVVAFITPDSATLAAKTLALLPASTRIIRLETRREGPVGAIALMLDAFRLTLFAGRQVGIDPGRPGVPGYGRRIYHLGPASGIRLRSCATSAAADERKMAARGTLANASDAEVVARARREFVARFKPARFGALVADFDGTVLPPGAGHGARLSAGVVASFEKLLKHHISIYFATGRGDSVHSILAGSLASSYHNRVFVAYYNGAIARPLSESPPKPEESPHCSEFGELLKQMQQDSFIAGIGTPDNKGFQLTLKTTDQAMFAATTAIRELVARQGNGRFKVVQSSHSLDIIPSATTKLACVRLAQSSLAAGLEVLTVGDRGALMGNDFDLLTHSYSLSVDAVSADLRSCWNLLPAGCRNVAGWTHYAAWLRTKAGNFGLSAPKELC